MSFIQDPRLRQRWNQLSHNAEAVTENAAAEIWTLQHRYVNPCLAGLAESIDGCLSLCLGDRDERARRARERDRGARRARAEYVFDFYDDWDDIDGGDDLGGFGGSGGGGGTSGSGGMGNILGNWGAGRAEDWDRLLAGTGSSSSRRGKYAESGSGAGDVVDNQPGRKRGMSYGTRGGRRKTAAEQEDDPTIIPSTAPLGFLSRLPFKIGGTLRYKPSAANLRDHPGAAPTRHRPEEATPLLRPGDEEDDDGPARRSPQTRARSATAGSGDTSDSYRSRNDLFPSDGEGEEDAVPLDDEFDIALDRVDDRGSNKTRSSKGKRPAGGRPMSRTVSRTTVSSLQTRHSAKGRTSSASIRAPEEAGKPQSVEDLQREEEEAEREEVEEQRRRRRAASQLALDRGLSRDDLARGSVVEIKAEMVQVDEIPEPSVAEHGHVDDEEWLDLKGPDEDEEGSSKEAPSEEFIPARLPHFR